MLQISRRSILVGSGASLVASGLGGCQTQQPVSGSFGQVAVAPAPSTPIPNGELVEEPIAARPSAVASAAYGPVSGERFPVPAAPLSRINPAFLRTRIAYARNEAPGTIVIDPRARYLYFVEESGRAMRYGVGVGREGFAWSGTATIHEKQEWPDWYPPKEMIQRQPEIKKQVEELEGGLGVPGGTRNPLGARAMYLWQNGKDTLYRIHGTLEPWTIGTSVSSGCIRMINQDAIDLYDRVPLGTKVVVIG